MIFEHSNEKQDSEIIVALDVDRVTNTNYYMGEQHMHYEDKASETSLFGETNFKAFVPKYVDNYFIAVINTK